MVLRHLTLYNQLHLPWQPCSRASYKTAHGIDKPKSTRQHQLVRTRYGGPQRRPNQASVYMMMLRVKPPWRFPYCESKTRTSVRTFQAKSIVIRTW